MSSSDTLIVWDTLIYFVGCGTIIFVVAKYVLPNLVEALKGLLDPQVAGATIGCILFIVICLVAVGTGKSWLYLVAMGAMLVCLALPQWLQKKAPDERGPSDKPPRG